MRSLAALLIFLISALCCASGAKILAIFHSHAYSHYQLGNALAKELALRGHEVTMISPFEQNPPIKNYKTIVLNGIHEYFNSQQHILTNFHNISFLEGIQMRINFLHTLNELTLNNTGVQDLLKSNEKFDLFIMEAFMNEAFRGFQHHYQVPCVVLSTVGAGTWINYLVGNPNNPSYASDIILGYGDKMTFFQRIVNNFMYVFNTLFTNLYSHRVQNELLHKYFPDAPHITEMLYNTSLVLLNSIPGVNQPLPLLPNMVEVGGLHLKPPGKLPKDLQNFLDESKQGVVYFSLGSNLKSKNLAPDQISAIVKSLSNLKTNVLWKFEGSLPDLPKNVKIDKWLPQQEILAHPNVKLFITHGGLLSTIETLYHGKPVLGIPHFADQTLNMKNAVRGGYGLSVKPDELTEETLTKALHELLTNNKYARNAEAKSKILRDQPMKPVEKAAYWVEYVIRHHGAYHLRSSALDLTWWQYSSLDVIGFCSAILITVSCLVKKGISLLCCRKSRKNNEASTSTKRSKIENKNNDQKRTGLKNKETKSDDKKNVDKTSKDKQIEKNKKTN